MPLVPGRRPGRRTRELLRLLGVRDLAVAPLYGEEGVVRLPARRPTGSARAARSTAGDARLLEALANHAGVALENGRLVDRVAARGARARVPGRARRAHRAARTARASSTRCATRSSDCGEQRRRRHADGPRPVQGRQRHARPRHRRRGAVARGGAHSRARSATRATVARLGGDEFAIAACPASPTSTTARRGGAPGAAPCSSRRSRSRGVSLEIAGSIGITVAPQHGTDAHTLLKRADIAMYSAKREPSRHRRVRRSDPTRTR